MSIAKYIICILENSLRYLSQLYSPGKSSRIGWWRGNCKKAPPPPLQMSGSDVNGAAYPSFRDRPQVHTRTPPAGGGGTSVHAHILYSDLYCTLATACFRLGVLRLNVRFSRLNARNCLKMTKSTNFKAYFR